jgi:hypothetical protein
MVPIPEVPPELLYEFLARAGMTRSVVDWRYRDEAFNRGRNRGFAWLRRDRVEGMIGLIPFEISGPGSSYEVNWSSDWILANPQANPGMGILLLRRAIESSTALFALGGNENTRRILPRIATRTIPDAAPSLHLLLRSGAILRRVEQRGPLARLPKPRLLYMIPLRRVPRRVSADVRTESGVSPHIGPLLESGHRGTWAPRYDLSYVSWQLGRSPLIRCWTCYAPGVGAPAAAALYWRAESSTDFWRIALWYQAGSDAALEATLRTAVAEVYNQGGMALSAIVSRIDTDSRAALRRIGFVPLGPRRPLYICAGREGAPTPELSGLSYLATDLGYRF